MEKQSDTQFVGKEYSLIVPGGKYYCSCCFEQRLTLDMVYSQIVSLVLLIRRRTTHVLDNRRQINQHM